MKKQESVKLELTHDEEIVLFELLSQRSEARALSEFAGGDAEVVALESLLCLFEKELAAPFQANYSEQLEVARARLTRED